MKLANYTTANGIRLGVVEGEEIILLPDAASGFPANVEQFIAGGEDARGRVLDALKEDLPRKAVSEVSLASPILRPGKFLAIGMNYQRHLEEAIKVGIEPPKYQYWFNKQVSCINGPYDPIVKPSVSDMLDFEVELAFVIGKPAKHVKASDALSYIAGYTVCNDVSVRDWQRHTPTFTIGKSFDTHGPLGPWFVTADEIPDPQTLGLRCFVNGEEMQNSNTADMIYKCADMIEYLSTAFTLEPGDVIATGTPEGVGAARDPKVFLKPGDVVRCEVDQIGYIENKIIADAK